jgi:glucosamine 6-phosphate synthetase-like amidotransferase/phosphosugar isomerase protein
VIDVDWDDEAAEKSGYETFMLKEIYEQPRAFARRSATASGTASSCSRASASPTRRSATSGGS